jgi:hypothetical protein
MLLAYRIDCLGIKRMNCIIERVLANMRHGLDTWLQIQCHKPSAQIYVGIKIIDQSTIRISNRFSFHQIDVFICYIYI